MIVVGKTSFKTLSMKSWLTIIRVIPISWNPSRDPVLVLAMEHMGHSISRAVRDKVFKSRLCC